eukprot:PhF_6_TR16575/c0_g1_i1/m.25260
MRFSIVFALFLVILIFKCETAILDETPPQQDAKGGNQGANNNKQEEFNGLRDNLRKGAGVMNKLFKGTMFQEIMQKVGTQDHKNLKTPEQRKEFFAKLKQKLKDTKDPEKRQQILDKVRKTKSGETKDRDEELQKFVKQLDEL